MFRTPSGTHVKNISAIRHYNLHNIVANKNQKKKKKIPRGNTYTLSCAQ